MSLLRTSAESFVGISSKVASLRYHRARVEVRLRGAPSALRNSSRITYLSLDPRFRLLIQNVEVESNLPQSKESNTRSAGAHVENNSKMLKRFFCFKKERSRASFFYRSEKFMRAPVPRPLPPRIQDGVLANR